MTAPHYTDEHVTVLHGDSIDLLREMPAESVDAVVCDPPYGLSKEPDMAEVLGHWLAGDDYQHRGGGFMGSSWDSFVPGPALWREVFRVLKPGGHLLAFAGSRTVDLMGCAVRLAGFEIRDSITWLYASGFPKSLNVSKAIDRARDDRASVLAVTTWLADQADQAGITRGQIDEYMGTSDMGGWWLSRLQHRCALPTPGQWERLRHFLGFGDAMDAEVTRLNARKGEAGEAWLNAETVAVDNRMNEPSGIVNVGQGERQPASRHIKRPGSESSAQWEGWGTALKPASEPIVVARKPLAGTVAANVLAHGTGALNVDASRTGETVETWPTSRGPNTVRSMAGGVLAQRETGLAPAGRWPTNVLLSHAATCGEVCAPGCPVAALDARSGDRKAGGNLTGNEPLAAGFSGVVYGSGAAPRAFTSYGDSGGASRFFPTFRFEAKAGDRERPEVDGEAHPTVKPLALMRWLVRLVTPPGGVVLDPFAGSGTTGEAAVLEGFRCLLIEKHAPYLPLIVSRLAPYQQPAVLARARGRGTTPPRGRPKPAAGDSLLDLLLEEGA